VQSTSTHPCHTSFISVLSSPLDLGLPGGLFLQVFQPKPNIYVLLVSSIHALPLLYSLISGGFHSQYRLLFWYVLWYSGESSVNLSHKSLLQLIGHLKYQAGVIIIRQLT